MAHECSYYCQGDVHAVRTLARHEGGTLEDIQQEMLGRDLLIGQYWYPIYEVVAIRPAPEAEWISDDTWSGGKDHPGRVPYITFVRIGEVESGK